MELQVGDKVKVWGFPSDSSYSFSGNEAFIKSIVSDSEIKIELLDKTINWYVESYKVHIKQCEFVSRAKVKIEQIIECLSCYDDILKYIPTDKYNFKCLNGKKVKVTVEEM